MTLTERLRTTDPGDAEIDEVVYRWGAYYVEKSDLKQAKRTFIDLQASSRSAAYKKMCAEYLTRIEQLESIEKERTTSK